MQNVEQIFSAVNESVEAERREYWSGGRRAGQPGGGVEHREVRPVRQQEAAERDRFRTTLKALIGSLETADEAA